MFSYDISYGFIYEIGSNNSRNQSNCAGQHLYMDYYLITYKYNYVKCVLIVIQLV